LEIRVDVFSTQGTRDVLNASIENIVGYFLRSDAHYFAEDVRYGNGCRYNRVRDDWNSALVIVFARKYPHDIENQ